MQLHPLGNFFGRNLGKIWRIWTNLGEIWAKMIKIWTNFNKIWAKLKSCIPKNIRSLTAMPIKYGNILSTSANTCNK